MEDIEASVGELVSELTSEGCCSRLGGDVVEGPTGRESSPTVSGGRLA